MANWGIYQSADWSAESTRVQTYTNETSYLVNSRIYEDRNIGFELWTPDVMQKEENLLIDEESKNILQMKQKYVFYVEKEATLCKKIEILEESLDTHELASKKMRQAFLEYGLFCKESQGFSEQEIHQLDTIEKSYIEKMEEFDKKYKKIQTEKRDSVKQELNFIQNNLSTYRQLIQSFLKEIVPEEKRQSNLCSICYEMQVNSGLNPCGHTFCKECTKKFRETCPTCRTSVRSILPLYL